MKYRLFYLMIIGFLLFTVDGLGQNTWVKTFGGIGQIWGNSIITLKDGSYVSTGSIRGCDDFIQTSSVDSDIVVIKLNPIGELVWKKRYGGSGYDGGNSIISTNDGGYIITGETSSNDGDFEGMNKSNANWNLWYDIFVIKLDSNGNIVWKKLYGGRSGEYGRSIIITNDGGYIITGETSSKDGDFNGMNKGYYDIFVMKLNINGDLLWKKTYGGIGYDIGSSITNTDDGGYILTGSSNSNDGDFTGMNKGESDIFIIKLNSLGDILWKKSIGGSNSEIGYSITNTIDSGFILTGNTNSNDNDFGGMSQGGSDIFLVKIDSNGDEVWKKIIGGSQFDGGKSIISTKDSGYILTGYTKSNDIDFGGMNQGFYDVFLIKLNNNGNLLWRKTYGGNNNDMGYSVANTIDSGFVLTGWTNSNYGDFQILNKGAVDIFVMKLDSNGNLNNSTSINEFSEPTSTLSVNPNPFHNSTTVSYKVDTPSNVRIELLNTLGQTVEVLREDYTDIGTYQLPLNVSNLSSGMYSVRMRSDSMNELVPVWVVK